MVFKLDSVIESRIRERVQDYIQNDLIITYKEGGMNIFGYLKDKQGEISIDFPYSLYADPNTIKAPEFIEIVSKKIIDAVNKKNLRKNLREEHANLVSIKFDVSNVKIKTPYDDNPWYKCPCIKQFKKN
ncbi:MAG: hypothetical protein FWE18_00275 [Alphaproteobacteria bacterium]|nr:hypothetical protein [Alphaproteobacteria bacterium]